MRYAFSIYWGGTVVDALDCDYESSRELGLHCPFCNEALFYRAGYHRIMPDQSCQQVAPSFAHYPNLGKECELRATRPEGQTYLQQLEIQSHNQRLGLYNKHFVDIIRQSIEISNEHTHIKTLRKLLGKDFTKPFIKLFLKEKINLKRIQLAASQNLEEVNQLAKLHNLTEAKRQEVREMAKTLGSFISNKNMLVAYEVALWLQSKSASWSLDRIILFAFIWQCEYHACIAETPQHTATLTFAKMTYQMAMKNPECILTMIYKILVSIDWQNLLTNQKISHKLERFPTKKANLSNQSKRL